MIEKHVRFERDYVKEVERWRRHDGRFSSFSAALRHLSSLGLERERKREDKYLVECGAVQPHD